MKLEEVVPAGYELRCWHCNTLLEIPKAVWLYYDPRSRTYSARQVAREYERGAFAFCAPCSVERKAEHAKRKDR